MNKSLCFLVFVIAFISCGDKKISSYHSVVGDTSYDSSVVPSITPEKIKSFINLIEITYNDISAKTSQLPSGSRAFIMGADVIIYSSLPNMEYRLSGATDGGSLRIVSDSTCLVSFDGLRLFSKNETAVNIISPNSVYFQCMRGKNNYIVDGTIEEQDDTLKNMAAFSVLGDALFCGNGNLAIKARRRNAIYCSRSISFTGQLNISIEDAPTHGINSEGNINIKDVNLRIEARKDPIHTKNGDLKLFTGNMYLKSKGDGSDGIQVKNFFSYGGNAIIEMYGRASKGINCKNMASILNGNITISTYGEALFSEKKGDYKGGAGIKTDGNLYMKDGYVVIENRGDGGKGINSNANIQIDGGMLLIRNEGRDVVDFSNVDAKVLSKGVTADGDIALNGGNVEIIVLGEGEGCEGLESKNKMYIGGDISLYVCAYDDAVNAAESVEFSGGRAYLYSITNDAIDGNGTISISDGLIIANGSDSPEQGIDTDFEGDFTITGGTLISIGGAKKITPCMPRNHQTAQPAIAWCGVDLDKGKFVNLFNHKGKALLSYNLPRSLKNSTVLVSAPYLKENSEFKLSFSDSISGAKFLGNGFYINGALNAGDNFVDAVSFSVNSVLSSISQGGEVADIELFGVDTDSSTSLLRGAKREIYEPHKETGGKGYNSFELPGGGWR